MNPFDLPGPQFLAFYALLGAGVAFALFHLKQKAEAGEPGRLPMSDPYVIAYLRGGAVEAVRLGVAVLVDRQLLAIGDGDSVTVREGVTPLHGSNDLERAILEECPGATSRVPREWQAAHPRDLTASRRLQDLARRAYEPGLLQMELIAGPDVHARRLRDATAAALVLLLVAGIKVAIGVSRNRPVSLLVVSAIAFTVVAFVLVRGMRTVRGDRILDDLRVLFDALKHRANELRPSTSTSELALLVAVFGLDSVPALAFPFVKAFRPARSASCGGAASCGSSSSGSSCGGGGGDGGGGGCGGCGS
jgi:uncharacterized protein (TIGR04222 family)